jgi:hypothetical protein
MYSPKQNSLPNCSSAEQSDASLPREPQQCERPRDANLLPDILSIVDISRQIFRADSFANFRADILGEIALRKRALHKQLAPDSGLLKAAAEILHTTLREILRASPYFSQELRASDGTSYLVTAQKEAIKISDLGVEYLDALVPIQKDTAAELFRGFEECQLHQYGGFQVNHSSSYVRGIPVEIKDFRVSWRDSERIIIDRVSPTGSLLIKNSVICSVENLHPDPCIERILRGQTLQYRTGDGAPPIYFVNFVKGGCGFLHEDIQPEYLAKGFVTSDGIPLSAILLLLYDSPSNTFVCSDPELIKQNRGYGCLELSQVMVQEFIEKYRVLQREGSSVTDLIESFDRAISKDQLRVFMSLDGSLAIGRHFEKAPEQEATKKTPLFRFQLLDELELLRSSIEANTVIPSNLTTKVFGGNLGAGDQEVLEGFLAEVVKNALCGNDPQNPLLGEFIRTLKIIDIYNILFPISPTIDFHYLGLETPPFLFHDYTFTMPIRRALKSIPVGTTAKDESALGRVLDALFVHYLAYCDFEVLSTASHTILTAFHAAGLCPKKMASGLAERLARGINDQTLLRHRDDEPVQIPLSDRVIAELLNSFSAPYQKKFVSQSVQLEFLAAQGHSNLIVFLSQTRPDLITTQLVEDCMQVDSTNLFALYGYQ